MSTQDKNSDAFDPVEALRAEIVAQTEAIRADEKQKQAVESVLLDLHRRIEVLEQTHRHKTETLDTVRSVVMGTYLEVVTLKGLLMEVMAKAWGMDRQRLADLDRQLTEKAFEKLDVDGVSIDVRAERDASVGVSKDKVGRDKGERR